MLLSLPAQAEDASDTGAPQSTVLTGDWRGIRTDLEDRGIQLGGDEILETLGTPDSRNKRGTTVEGRFELFANVDLGKTLGWQGALLHANAYQIHGEGLSSDYLGNLLTVSNIEGHAATRLFALWVQQSLFHDRVSLRAGQIAADDEFFVSQYASLFINSTFGWPGIMGINLPDGGPAYPVARPGIRARIGLTPDLLLSTAIFSGDPVVNKAGFNFHLNGDVFAIGELAYGMALFQLPGTMKLGAWMHTGRFTDQRYDAAGISLADTQSGMPRQHRGDYGGYLIIDQLLWRASGTEDSGLGSFLRLGGDPSDRNLIELHMDGGLTYAKPFGRDGDTIGIAVSYERVSTAQRDLALDYQHLSGTMPAMPDFESALELSYQAQIASWWIIQPDVQWIIHPGGRVLDLASPLSNKGASATVLGLRTAIAL